MRFPIEKDKTLAGSLLVAHPALMDDNFRRSVIYIASHDSEGTLGFVINRPSGKTISDFVADEELTQALGAVPVFRGGPVGTNQLIISIFKEAEGTGDVFCSHGLSLNDVKSMADSSKGVVRAFIGHSGWAEGQLDSELERHSWFVNEAPGEILELEQSVTAWERLMCAMGPWHTLQAKAPEHPERN